VLDDTPKNHIGGLLHSRNAFARNRVVEKKHPYLAATAKVNAGIIDPGNAKSIPGPFYSLGTPL
jgi:hypothetical protein